MCPHKTPVFAWFEICFATWWLLNLKTLLFRETFCLSKLIIKMLKAQGRNISYAVLLKY